jgi:hypothetical protein
MMSCARVCPFKSVGCSFETIVVTRLRTRRCDRSFVVADPVQTSVGEFDSSSWCGKVGARQRFQAVGLFCTSSCGNRVLCWPIVVSTRQHSPRDPCELVRQSDHDCVLGRSGIECVEPGSDGCSVALNPQYGSPCTMDQNLAEVHVEYWRGTIPSHAAKSRPLRNAAPLPMAATMAVATTTGPIPRICRIRVHPASAAEIRSSSRFSCSICCSTIFHSSQSMWIKVRICGERSVSVL